MNIIAFLLLLKMKTFLLLAFIPSLIAADNLCPNSKTTCPEDKQCCEVDGEYSCCDADGEQDVPDTRLKVYPGVEIRRSAVFQNVSFSANETAHAYGFCSYSNCRGTCCSTYGCCEDYVSATCCTNQRCCPSFKTCCPDGCCGFMENCCGDGCCEYGYNCCGGSYCCKKGSRCDLRRETCVAKGTLIHPEFAALLLVVAGIFMFYRL